MKNLLIKNSFIEISKDEIGNFEKNNNIFFPIYLKDFFMQYNGAKIREAFYGDQYYISFLPLYSNRNASVELILSMLRNEEEGINRNDLIPFGIDPGGRPFYVSIGDADQSAVYYNIVGFGEEKPLRKLADSFEEFINGLKPEEDK